MSIPLAWLVLFGGTGAAALVTFAARRRSLAWGRLALALVTAPVFLLPWVLPPDQRVLRFAFAMYAFCTFTKLMDLNHPRTLIPDAKAWLVFLINPSLLVFRRAGAEPRIGARENVRRIVTGSLQAAAACALWYAWSSARVERLSDAVAYAGHIVVFYVGLLGVFRAFIAFLRVVLGNGRDSFGNVFTAPTPAELWRRYNRNVAQFLQDNVFMPAGGLRNPVRGTLITFAFSAVVHEYVFWPAIGRIQGYQTAFFLLQGVAVAATLRFRPSRRAYPVCVALTILFNIVSSWLFFASMRQVVPW